MPAIVYLQARGTGAFRSKLRSDTLWGAICWSIRELYGEQVLGDLVTAYLSDDSEDSSQLFYLSSAFPWLEVEGKKTHYLPYPFSQPPLSEEMPLDVQNSPKTIKAHFKKRKNEEARKKGWLSWEQFDYHFGRGTAHDLSRLSPKVDTRAVTRNQIDRRTLGTFTENDSGQLFHMNENYIKWDDSKQVDKHGLYFLLDGDTSKVIPALRILESTGIAGDRTVGKGNFQIEVITDAHDLPGNDFSLPKVNSPNARVNLSIYNAADDMNTLQAYETAASQNERSWQYRLEARQGRTFLQGDYLQESRLLFTEGSVFPLIQTNHSPYPGKNWVAGKHHLGHDIHRYGHAFMLDIHLK